MDFSLPITSDGVTDGTIEKFDHENMRVSARILFLASPEADTHLGAVLPPPLITNVCKINLVICEGQ